MRKASHEALNKVVAHGINEYQMEEAVVLARNALQRATSWDKLIRRASASTMLRSVYDEAPVSSYPEVTISPASLSSCQVTSEDDARVKEINEFSETTTAAAAPGAYWVRFTVLMSCH